MSHHHPVSMRNLEPQDREPLLVSTMGSMTPPTPGFRSDRRDTFAGSYSSQRSCWCCCLVCTDHTERACIQKFGRLEDIRKPGLHLIWWPFQTAAFVSTQVRQLDVVTDTKTKDNVTVRVTVALQFSVDPNRVDVFYFRLNDPERQLSACVEDSVRSFLPSLDLDEAYVSKDAMAESIRTNVARQMDEFGIDVVKALVTDLCPDPTVMKAMNEMNAARRLRIAAVERAEMEKILVVKKAEASAEAMHLSGMGTGKQREAITEGLASAIQHFDKEDGMQEKDVLFMMLAQQYLDLLNDFSMFSPNSFLNFPMPQSTAAQLARFEMHDYDPPRQYKRTISGDGIKEDLDVAAQCTPPSPANLSKVVLGDKEVGLESLFAELHGQGVASAAALEFLLKHPDNVATAPGMWQALQEIQKRNKFSAPSTADAPASMTTVGISKVSSDTDDVNEGWNEKESLENLEVGRV